MDEIRYAIDCCFDELLENNILATSINILEGQEKVLKRKFNNKYDGYICYKALFFLIPYPIEGQYIPISCGIFNEYPSDHEQQFMQKIKDIASNYSINIVQDREVLFMGFG